MTDLSKGTKAEDYMVLSESCGNRCWKSLNLDTEELNCPSCLKIMSTEGNEPADIDIRHSSFNVGEGYKNFTV